jgi:hypothetical protein
METRWKNPNFKPIIIHYPTMNELNADINKIKAGMWDYEGMTFEYIKVNGVKVWEN